MVEQAQTSISQPRAYKFISLMLCLESAPPPPLLSQLRVPVLPWAPYRFLRRAVRSETEIRKAFEPIYFGW